MQAKGYILASYESLSSVPAQAALPQLIPFAKRGMMSLCLKHDIASVDVF